MIRLSLTHVVHWVALASLCDARLPVKLRPGDNVQAAVDVNPTGTAFILGAGVYRSTSFAPKQGDQFQGEPGTKLNGSLLLPSRWIRSERGDFLLDHLPAALPQSGQAGPGHAMARHPQDLFVDGALYQRVEARDAIGSGKWFFDEAARRAYVAEDLDQHVVEIGQMQQAIVGTASDIVLKDLTVERYAAPAQFGAIVIKGDRWVLKNLNARQNHGEGVVVFGKEARIEGGSYSDNGQEGISGFRCDGLVIENANIARNNYAGFAIDWQAGGIKVSTASRVTYAGNVVDGNHGVGIWDDAQVADAAIHGNLVADNDSNGIMHEISYKATIYDNRVIRNGDSFVTPVVPAGILLQSSSDVDVHDNYVETRATAGNGITMTYEPRGVGTQGPYRTDHNIVHDNVIVFPGWAGINGIFAYSDRATAVSFHNLWTGNSYRMGDKNRHVFNVLGQLLTLTEAQSRNIETGSKIMSSSAIAR